ncbi:MAG: porin, partial [Lacipirellulaceae bacterium]
MTAILDSEVFQEFPSEPHPASGESALISDPVVSHACHTSPFAGNTFQTHVVGVGYEEGFVIAAPGPMNLRASDSPYLLRLNGWGQLRHTVLDSQGANPDVNQFQLKRARLVFSGHAYTPDFAYYVQLDGRSSSGDDVRLLDYFLTYDIGRHLWERDQGTLVFKTGQYKMPFTMARSLSGREFEFSDRAMASTFFDVNRSLAWGLAGQQNQAVVPWNWEVAVFNGLVTGGAETGSSGTLDDNFAYSGRIVAFPIGEWGLGALADFDQHEQLAVRSGLAFATTTID